MDQETLKKYRIAGRTAGKALQYGLDLIQEGESFISVADGVEKKIRELGAEVAFPTNIAVDNQAAHYTPVLNDELVFRRGMLVKLDVGAHVDGFIGDTAATKEVGSSKYGMLIQASREALNNALDIIKPGIEPQTLGTIIENTIRSFGYEPISNLTGHSLEKYTLHAGTSIPNVNRREGGPLKVGDVVAIEPFATDGAGFVDEREKSNIYIINRDRKAGEEKADLLRNMIVEKRKGLPFSQRWCAQYIPDPRKILRNLERKRVISSYPILYDIDNGKVSQAEHSIIVTEDGCEILTKI